MSHRRKETRYMCKYCSVWIHNNVAARSQHEKTKTHLEKARLYLEKQQEDASAKKKQEKEKEKEMERINIAAAASMQNKPIPEPKIESLIHEITTKDVTKAPSGLNRKERRALMQKQKVHEGDVVSLPPAPLGWSKARNTSENNKQQIISEQPQRTIEKIDNKEQELRDIEFGGEVAFGSAVASTMWGWNKSAKKVDATSRSSSESSEDPNNIGIDIDDSIKRHKTESPTNESGEMIIDNLNTTLSTRTDTAGWSDTPVATTVSFKKKSRKQSSETSDSEQEQQIPEVDNQPDDEDAAPIIFKKRKQRNLRTR